uniref:Uncharacterized protein n=1 Tax=Nothobranchius pienaari TaxID=704102 RepID=A0A1A8LJW8_9TELE
MILWKCKLVTFRGCLGPKYADTQEDTRQE